MPTIVRNIEKGMISHFLMHGWVEDSAEIERRLKSLGKAIG